MLRSWMSPTSVKQIIMRIIWFLRSKWPSHSPSLLNIHFNSKILPSSGFPAVFRALSPLYPLLILPLKWRMSSWLWQVDFSLFLNLSYTYFCYHLLLNGNNYPGTSFLRYPTLERSTYSLITSISNSVCT